MNPSSTFATTPAPRGVTPNLRNACGGIWRISSRRVISWRQLLNLAWTTALLAVLAGLSVREGNAPSFYTWMIKLYLTVLVPIIAFMSGAGAIREDMKPGGVDYLLTRPVPRPAFVAARFVSHLLCVQGLYLVPFAAVLFVGFQHHISELASTWPLLLQAQILTLTAFMGLGFLFGSLTARYLVLGINYAAIVEVGLGQIPIQLSKLSVLRNINNLLLPVTPGNVSIAAEPQGFLATATILGLLTIGWLVVAALVFTVQEFAGQRPKDA